VIDETVLGNRWDDARAHISTFKSEDVSTAIFIVLKKDGVVSTIIDSSANPVLLADLLAHALRDITTSYTSGLMKEVHEQPESPAKAA
jgi:hypothetical protein